MDSAKSDKEKAADEAIKGETGNVDKLSSEKQTDEMASIRSAQDEVATQETDEQSTVNDGETSVQPTALDDHFPNIQLDR